MNYEERAQQVGRRMREARERRDLSQDDVAPLVGLKSGAGVGRWERGLLPQVGKLYRLCEALGITYEWLTEPLADGPPVHQVLDDMERQIAELRAQLARANSTE